MTFEEIDDKLNQFEARLQKELNAIGENNQDQIASEYEPVDCDPPPVVFKKNKWTF